MRSTGTFKIWGTFHRNLGTHAYNGEPLANSVDREMATGWEATPSHRLRKYKLGINEFSDMAPDEFATTHFGYTKTPWGNLKNLGTHGYNDEPLADSVDR